MNIRESQYNQYGLNERLSVIHECLEGSDIAPLFTLLRGFRDDYEWLKDEKSQWEILSRDPYPFHGLPHFESVANSSSLIARRMFLENPDFREKLIKKLKIRQLNEAEQINAVETVYQICGLFHDVGNFYKEGEDGALVSILQGDETPRLERSEHEARSFKLLSKEVNNEGSKLKILLNQLGVDEDGFLEVAEIAIMATKLNASFSNQEIFDKVHESGQEDNSDLILGFPVAFADLPFAPEVEPIWNRMRDDIILKFKPIDDWKYLGSMEVIEIMHKSMLLVNHMLFELEGSESVEVGLNGCSSLSKIATLVVNNMVNVSNFYPSAHISSEDKDMLKRIRGQLIHTLRESRSLSIDPKEASHICGTLNGLALLHFTGYLEQILDADFLSPAQRAGLIVLRDIAVGSILITHH